MDGLYPDEGKRLDVIGHLEEIRKRILISLIFISVSTIAAFYFGGMLFEIVKLPVKDYVKDFVFISPTEAFTAYFKLSLLAGFSLSFPVILYQVWAFIAPAFSGKMKMRLGLWLMLSFLLFMAGILFAYFLAVPAALRFLLSFGSEISVPMISIGKYISFFGAMILIGGIVFEIPIVISIVVDMGFIDTKTLRSKRALAFIMILALAAAITPTQDIMNMMIFAVPMYLLYEIGILLGVLIEIRRK
ncbi:MAG: twin-arginine translocase subunit TatC [Candidatus Omnitrophica bacterium]|nr:twin-arginine translocase subunit TatC [Candidatus Omnitrophota bacterium]